MVVYLATFPMPEAHESLFRDAVREHAVENMVSGTRTWAIQP